MHFQSVTFDLDGTLLDTAPDLHEAARRMLLELGLPPRSEAEIRQFVGQGVAMLVRRCLPDPDDEAGVAAALPVFEKHYAAVNGKNSRIFPNVLAALETWRATGLPMAVVTNKPGAFTLPLLERTGLAPYFAVVVSGDSTPHRKPHPAPLWHACDQMATDPEANLHIGDSRHDIETAHNAGCAVYCVPYGYHQDAPLAELGCDALVADLAEALEIAGCHRPCA